MWLSFIEASNIYVRGQLYASKTMSDLDQSSATENVTNDFKRRIQRKLKNWNRPTPSK